MEEGRGGEGSTSNIASDFGRTNFHLKIDWNKVLRHNVRFQVFVCVCVDASSHFCYIDESEAREKKIKVAFDVTTQPAYE